MTTHTQLILFPNVLNEEETDLNRCFAMSMIQEVGQLDGLIAESEKGGRYFLKRFPFPEGKSFRDVPIRVLSEHTTNSELQEMLSLVQQGGKWGLISDAGLPCIADPGAVLVYLARQKGIEIKAYIGPSSIILALMLSGLGAQKFTFEGYLPKENGELLPVIKQIQQRAQKERSTHIFIETPYRAQSLWEKLTQNLNDGMKLSIACDLMMPTQSVMTYSIQEWKKRSPPSLQKRLVVFVVAV